MAKKKKTCSICSGEFIGWGNDPSPMPGEYCCDGCNRSVVFPLRILMIRGIPNYCAVLIEQLAVKFIKPKGKYFTLKELQNCVGGPIEIAPAIYKGCFIVVNEEGPIYGLPKNEIFEQIYRKSYVGNVLIVPEGIFEEAENTEEEES